MYQEKAMHYKEKKRSKTLAILLAVDVCVCICILLAAWAVFLKEPQAVALAPDYAPSEIEPNQTPLVEESSDPVSDDSGTGDDVVEAQEEKKRVSLSFTKDVTVSLTNKTATLYLGSGERSLVDIVVQIVVQDHVLAQSGKLTPGNKVEQLELVEGIETLLSEGGYEGALLLHYYEPDTSEKSVMVNSIPVTVTIQK